MNEQAENEVLEQNEPAEQLEAEQAASETLNAEQVEGEQGGNAAAEDGELVISFGEEAPTSEEAEHKEAPAWVKELRKADREKAKRIRELEAQVAARAEAEKPLAAAKPTLAECDFDEDVFAEKLTAYHEAERAAKAARDAKAAQEQKQAEAWQATVSAYQTATKALKVDDFESAEESVKGTLNPMQMAIVLDAVSTPEAAAKLVFALGSNPNQLKQLASTVNPVKFAIAVSKLEEKMTVQPRKAAPAPEKTLKGGAPAVGVTDTKLAQLEAAAEKSGNWDPVLAYKRAKKAQQA